MRQLSIQERIGQAYDILGLLRICGIHDITEGIYVNPLITATTQTWGDYLAAQHAQGEFLLDEVACTTNSRILDIGCGNGPLLKKIATRGAHGTGVTLSRSQALYCNRASLDAHLLDYQEAPPEWTASFHGVIANGSPEHFAQPMDAVRSNDSRIYRNMFEKVHSLLIQGGRFATTIIHFRNRDQVDPKAIAQGPYVHARGSDNFHFAMILEQVLHGWYPQPGQLERCASGLFNLVQTQDGTHDYYLTSEFWLRTAWQNLKRNPRIWFELLKMTTSHPFNTWDAFRHYMWDQSWMWQFRGETPPTQLLRHTWQAI
jgi:cyclopropane fatty-acyl-phospholipid synthase-like methyltransferase